MKNELDLFRGNFLNPTHEFGSLQREINHLFNNFGWMASHRHNRNAELAFAPAWDVEETDGQYLMNLDLPGVKKEDVKIELRDRNLIISGERKSETKEDKKLKHVVERYHGSFQRVLTLPDSVNADQIQASFENGVLKVAIPKAEAAKPKQIKITDGKTAASPPVTTSNQKIETKGSKSNENAPSVRIA